MQQQHYTSLFAFALVLAYVIVPGIAHAAPQTFQELATMVIQIINVAVPVIITFALASFLYGLTKTLLSAGDSKKYTEGRYIMIYGVLSLFVIVAVWALLEVAQRTIFGTTIQSTNIVNPVDMNINTGSFGN